MGGHTHTMRGGVELEHKPRPSLSNPHSYSMLQSPLFSVFVHRYTLLCSVLVFLAGKIRVFFILFCVNEGYWRVHVRVCHLVLLSVVFFFRVVIVLLIHSSSWRVGECNTRTPILGGHYLMLEGSECDIVGTLLFYVLSYYSVEIHQRFANEGG